MALQETLQKLGNSTGEPCVSISFNTHRTHPDHLQDEIVLKNLVKEAKARVEEEYGKRPAMEVLEKLDGIEKKVDIQYNLDSLHIFLSKDTEEIVKSTWSTRENQVHVDETFAVRPLIKALNRTEEYLIMILGNGGAHLYHAQNDSVSHEVENHIFPFGENPNDTPYQIRRLSDSEYMDDLTREHFRDIDKALVDYIREKDVDYKVIVISTEDNYSKLLQVATQPNIYEGHDDINYVEKDHHHIAAQAWEIIKNLQHEKRKAAIEEMKEAVSQSKVITDLREIFQAAIDGRGDLLIVHQDFEQPVKMTDERNFEYAEDAKEPGVLDDIVSSIAWEVLSKKGRVFFTSQEEIKDLGKIVLKTRY